MKCAVVTFLVLASTVTALAIAQEGTGQGPPKPNTIIVLGPLSLPTTGSVPPAKLAPPESR
jgi:hypothetical protein